MLKTLKKYLNESDIVFHTWCLGQTTKASCRKKTAKGQSDQSDDVLSAIHKNIQNEV